VPVSKGVTEAWRAAEAASPVEWAVMGMVRGPREADPKIDGDDWVTWAKGPHAGERMQGEGGLAGAGAAGAPESVADDGVTLWQRFALTALILVAGCQSLLPSDGCTLQLVAPPADEPTLVEPDGRYVVELIPADMAPATALIALSGSGWRPGDVEIEARGPDGAGFRDSVSWAELEYAEPGGWGLDRPGLWQFWVHNAEAGCERSFTIEAREQE
jgi:hypothetical protein